MEARNCRSDRRETGTQIGQLGKIENRIGYQIRKLHRISNPKTASDIKSENPLVFFAKTENQMLKIGISANRNEHQNRKTEVFWYKNQKTDLKNS